MLRGWEGWRFGLGGALFSPDGRSFKPWELDQIKLVFSMARHFRLLVERQAEADRSAATPRRPAFVQGLRLLAVAS